MPPHPGMYSGGLICGVGSGLSRGATGQMSEMDRGGKSMLGWWEVGGQHEGRPPGFGPGDVKWLMRGNGAEITRGG